MKTNYPINMKSPGAHSQIVKHDYKFSEKDMHPSFRAYVDKIMFTNWGQTDKRTGWNQYTPYPKLRLLRA